MTKTCNGPSACLSTRTAGAHKARRGVPGRGRQPLWKLLRQLRTAWVLPEPGHRGLAGACKCGAGARGKGGERGCAHHLLLPRRPGHVDGPPADPGAAQRLERALRLASMPAPQQPPHGRPPGAITKRIASVQTTALTLRHSRPALSLAPLLLFSR
jgi:hypothetical protein